MEVWLGTRWFTRPSRSFLTHVHYYSYCCRCQFQLHFLFFYFLFQLIDRCQPSFSSTNQQPKGRHVILTQESQPPRLTFFSFFFFEFCFCHAAKFEITWCFVEQNLWIWLGTWEQFWNYKKYHFGIYLNFVFRTNG